MNHFANHHAPWLSKQIESVQNSGVNSSRTRTLQVDTRGRRGWSHRYFPQTGLFVEENRYKRGRKGWGERDTRHTLDKRTTLRASHISKPSTISPTMKRNLFFHVQWLQWPAVLAALFTKCFMHASQIWSKSIIGEYRQSCYTAFFFFLIFFSTFFVFFRFWTKFVELSTGVSILSIHPAKQRRFHPGGAGFRFCSRTRDDLLRFKRETVKRQWGNRNTENICNLNSPGEKRIRYFRDSVLRYLGTAAGEFQKWVLGKFVYPRR